MVRYTIEIPDDLNRELQERRHRIDVSQVCRDALQSAVASSPTREAYGQDVAEDILRMFNG
jgi:metal-responsive CopG/Arc/MetJ family transcriptional regulator